MYKKKEFEKRYLLIIIIVAIAILLVVLSVALKKDRNLNPVEKIVKDSGTFVINVISAPVNFIKDKIREGREKMIYMRNIRNLNLKKNKWIV